MHPRREGTDSPPARLRDGLGWSADLQTSAAIDFGSPCGKLLVARLFRHGKPGVALGVFVAATHEGIGWQGREFAQAAEHLGCRALEQPPTSKAEQGIAAKQDRARLDEIGDVPDSVTWRVNNVCPRIS